MSKDEIIKFIDENEIDLIKISNEIHTNPELGHQEYKAQSLLTETLDRWGFIVQRSVGGFETSFVSSLPDKKDGPTIAILAEYDALPGLGHACGHNLIAAAALGAAHATRSFSGELQGNIVVIGTPAEEGSSPPVKAGMIERGIFDEVDIAMMAHGRDRTCTGGQLLAVNTLEIIYRGKASHASANPEDGVSALDAALLSIHGIEMLREHVRSDVRIHGIITDGGQAANIVPERSAMRYYVRALDRPYLETVVSRVENCARAGAMATGAEVQIITLGKLDNRLNIDTLNKLLLNNARLAGAQRIKPHPLSLGSSDFGTLSHTLPAATLYIEVIPEGTALHTKEMEKAAGSKEGHRAVLIGAKAMACTIYDLLTNPWLVEKIKREFIKAKRAK
jgi:amidohydrolase